MIEKIDPDRREDFRCKECGGNYTGPSGELRPHAINCPVYLGILVRAYASPANPGGQWDVPEPKSDEPQVFSQGMSSAQFEMHEAMNKLVRMVFEHERKFQEMERNGETR